MRDLGRRSPAAPRGLETRWPCPVCVGVLMDKKHVDKRAGSVTVDYCSRCGGLWFDRGEIAHLAQRDEAVIHPLLIDPAARVRPPCQECGSGGSSWQRRRQLPGAAAVDQMSRRSEETFS